MKPTWVATVLNMRITPWRNELEATGRGAVGKTASGRGTPPLACPRISAQVVELSHQRYVAAPSVRYHAGKGRNRSFTERPLRPTRVWSISTMRALNTPLSEYGLRHGLVATESNRSGACSNALHKGTFHMPSPKLLHRYAIEFAGKH